MTSAPEPHYWHHPVDDIEPEQGEACSDTAEAVAAVFDAVILDEFEGDCERGPAFEARGPFKRFLAMLWLMDPDRWFQGRDEKQVAQYLGFERASFSRMVRELSERLRIRNRFMKREGAVDVYSARQTRIWEERRANSLRVQGFLNIAGV